MRKMYFLMLRGRALSWYAAWVRDGTEKTAWGAVNKDFFGIAAVNAYLGPTLREIALSSRARKARWQRIR